MSAGIAAAGCLPVEWPVDRRIQALATTRRAPGRSAPPFDRSNLGARSGDALDIVLDNRRALDEALGLPSRPVWLRQVHGTAVLAVDEPLIGPRALDDEPVADAAVTSTPGVVLAIQTADCLPVLFATDDGATIGAAHAGWRGLRDGVLERTLGSMAAPPEQLSAWFGPAIGAASYEVGDEVRDAFLTDARESAPCFVPTRPGHWRCDLYGLARLRLVQAGVTRIHGGGFDTFADLARFHSYRRDGASSGRQASLIWIDVDAATGMSQGSRRSTR